MRYYRNRASGWGCALRGSPLVEAAGWGCALRGSPLVEAAGLGVRGCMPLAVEAVAGPRCGDGTWRGDGGAPRGFLCAWAFGCLRGRAAGANPRRVVAVGVGLLSHPNRTTTPLQTPVDVGFLRVNAAPLKFALAALATAWAAMYTDALAAYVVSATQASGRADFGP